MQNNVIQNWHLPTYASYTPLRPWDSIASLKKEEDR